MWRSIEMTRRVFCWLAACAALAVTLVTTVVTTLGAERSDEHWVATWGTAQLSYRAPANAAQRGPAPPATPPATLPPAPPAPPPGTPARRFGVPPALPGLNHQTIRM